MPLSDDEAKRLRCQEELQAEVNLYGAAQVQMSLKAASIYNDGAAEAVSTLRDSFRRAMEIEGGGGSDG